MKNIEKPDPRPMPSKPEISNPGVKEQQEINKEQKELDTDPLKKNTEKPELPKLPEELPEIKPQEKKS